MNKQLTLAAALLTAATWVAAASAVPTIDGSLDAEYGAALSIQNTNTQFGNATNGDPINGGGGSEIDGVYAKVVGTGANKRLYVFVAGNLETNFNKLEFFFDTKTGGKNSLIGLIDNDPMTVDPNELPLLVDPFCCGGFAPPNGGNTFSRGALQRMNGLTFDAGFSADYYLTVTHGFEGNIGGSGITAYAASAHFADLGQGNTGVGQALGMQLAQRGLPNVLRGTTADVNADGFVDGADVLAVQRGLGNTVGVTRAQGDAAAPFGTVDAADVALIASKHGFSAATSSLTDNFFAPQNAGDNSNILVGPAIPDLVQGQLIDKAWVTTHAGFAAPEVLFATDVVSPLNNPENRRNMLNTVDLRLGIDNSNIAGVSGAGPYTSATVENPGAVNKGIEFSIPLASIGNPTGSLKLFAFVNGGGHDYSANQFSGTGILDGNLGGNGTGGFTGDLSGVNMLDFAGDQFVTVTVPPAVAASGAVPEPASLALVLCGLLGLRVGRRK